VARKCPITGKAPMSGNNVSHANNKTKRRFLPNLQKRRIFVESENRWISLRISHAGMRIIDKIGIDARRHACTRRKSLSQISRLNIKEQ